MEDRRYGTGGKHKVLAAAICALGLAGILRFNSYLGREEPVRPQIRQEQRQQIPQPKQPQPAPEIPDYGDIRLVENQ